MDMDDAQIMSVGIGDNELRDGVLPHHLEGVDGILRVENGAGVGMHDVGSNLGSVTRLHHAAQVTVGDDAADLLALDDDGTPQTLGGHLDDGVVDGGGRSDGGTLVLDIEVADAEIELLAEGSAWMEARKVAGGEIAAFDERHREGVAHDELRRGTAGGSQVVGARLMLHGGVEHQVRLVRQERICIAHNGDELVAEVFDKRYQDLDFRGVAALGDADDHIPRTHHTEVAVDSVGSMEEEGGSTGGVECRDSLDGDIGTLADTGDNDTPRGRKNRFHRFSKCIINIIAEIFDGFFFRL